MGPLLSPSRTTVEARSIDRPTALVSIDLETDYGSGLDEALSQTGRLLDLLARLDVPLTAFVEGQFFERRRPLCRMLLEAGVDVQLHCYDHAEPGDSPATLRRGALAFEDCCGRAPEGYRAHTYQLTHELYETLLERGFQWDSSLMRGLGQGRNRHGAFQRGDYFVLGGRLLEFPIARWRALPLPLNHAYRLLLRTPAEHALWALSGPERLLTFNVHMTDLVRCGSLAASPIMGLPRLLLRCMWAGRGADTFGSLASFLSRVRQGGWAFSTTQALFERLAARAVLT
jgi:hypothetical protein